MTDFAALVDDLIIASNDGFDNRDEYKALLDAISALQKELAQEVKNKKEFERDWLKQCDANDALQSALAASQEALRKAEAGASKASAALRKYGRHDNESICQYGCICGLEAALSTEGDANE